MSDILSQLAQLAGPIMKSPQGQQMAQAIMQQMQGGGGGDPRGQMQGQGTMGRGPATDMEVENMDQANSNVSGQPTQMSTEDELAQAQAAMGGQQVPNTGGVNQGGAGMNQEGPTPEEIQLLKSSPSPRNVANFNKLFGPGAAEQVLQGGGGAGASYEDHVRGAMQDPDAANHAQGKYGHKGRGEPLDGMILDEDD